MQIIKEQNKLSKKSNFVDWMGQMFASRYNIMDSILSYTGDDYLGRKSFQRSNRIINISLRIYNNEEVDIDCYSSAERSLYKKLLEDNSKTLCDVLELIDKQIDKMTGYTLNSYFHNIYATLKIIHQDTTLTYDEKKNYLLMYRSQFTQQELKTIYIHALFYKDSDGNKKFKDIIEKTSFFQSINSIALKKYVLGKLPEDFAYKEGAFNPDQANR